MHHKIRLYFKNNEADLISFFLQKVSESDFLFLSGQNEFGAHPVGQALCIAAFSATQLTLGRNDAFAI